MHDLPLSFVEYEKIRECVNYLNYDAKMTSRNTSVSKLRKYTVKLITNLGKY